MMAKASRTGGGSHGDGTSPLRETRYLTDTNLRIGGDLSVGGDISTPNGPILRNWYSATDWAAFTAVPVTVAAAGNDISLAGSAGVGTATAVGAGGNDRRFYELKGFRAADAEVRCDFDPGGAQLALGLRHNNGVAVVCSWCNVLFGNTVNHLWGVWEWAGVGSFPTNQGAGTLNGFKSPVLSASGSGAAVTVKTRYPHGVSVGDLVDFDSSFGAFGAFSVATVPDAVTFTFADVTVGTWTGGTFRWVLPYQAEAGRQKVAARLTRNRLTYKQWLPPEPEPGWADPLRALSVTLPTSLSGGHPVPAGEGGWGFFVNHLTDSAASVSVNDFQVVSLDGTGVNS